MMEIWEPTEEGKRLLRKILQREKDMEEVEARGEKKYCPKCERMMQELYTLSSTSGRYGRLAFICPWCTIVVIDEWKGDGDTILTVSEVISK